MIALHNDSQSKNEMIRCAQPHNAWLPRSGKPMFCDGRRYSYVWRMQTNISSVMDRLIRQERSSRIHFDTPHTIRATSLTGFCRHHRVIAKACTSKSRIIKRVQIPQGNSSACKPYWTLRHRPQWLSVPWAGDITDRSKVITAGQRLRCDLPSTDPHR